MSDVGVINYGMGNIDSVCRAIEKISYGVEVINNPQQLSNVPKIILPGVGAYPAAMEHLHSTGFVAAIKQAVNEQQKPLLGICLGMQILSDVGEENGQVQGLGLIPGKVVKLQSENDSERIPHVGWNEVNPVEPGDGLFTGIKNSADFYFVHSYFFDCDNEENVLATTPYCGKTIAAVQKGLVFGMQFHPEKSQKFGLKLLENFLEL